MCVGCHEMKPKKILARIVKNDLEEISVDLIGKKQGQGRGAYVCKNIECLNKAIKTKKLDRAFSCIIPVEVYELLRQQMEEVND